MLRGLIAAAGFVFLTACELPSTTYVYRDNTSIAQLDGDSFQCELEASQAVPVSTRVGSTPAYVTPAYTSCYGYTCTTTGGQVVGGQTYSYDANQSLRNEYYVRCMVSRGYSAAAFPTCTVEAGTLSQNLRAQLGGELRQPAAGACAIPVSNRSSNLIYPGET